MEAHSIGKDHESVVGLSSQDSSNALRRVPHRVERQEVVLPDAVGISQKLEASFEYSALRVL